MIMNFSIGQEVYVHIDNQQFRGRVQEIYAKSNKLSIILEDGNNIVVDSFAVKII